MKWKPPFTGQCLRHVEYTPTEKPFTKKRKGFNLERKGKQKFSRKNNLLNIYQFYVNTILIHSVLS